jgi:hypothetical protein
METVIKRSQLVGLIARTFEMKVSPEAKAPCVMFNFRETSQ